MSSVHRRRQLGLSAALIASAMWCGARAAEIRGSVVETDGTNVVVRSEGEMLPAVGDRGEVYVEIPGLDIPAMVAEGFVSETGDAVRLKISKAFTTVKPGYRVKIDSSAPRPRVAVDTPRATPPAPVPTAPTPMTPTPETPAPETPAPTSPILVAPVPPAPAPAAPAPAVIGAPPVATPATARHGESYWTNSLGMPFAPVAGTKVMFCVWETRIRDYGAFVNATRYEASGAAVTFGPAGLTNSGGSWVSPGFPQTPDHPATCVNWEDAHAFCRWLTAKEQREGILGESEEYRLPSDAEWSVAAGLNDENGDTPAEKDGRQRGYPWGNIWPPPPGAGNYAGDESQTPASADGTVLRGYDDGHPRTSPVGSYRPNRYGLCDLGGNIWEWCSDRFDREHAWRVARGASWNNGHADFLMSSKRMGMDPANRNCSYGFRCVLSRPNAPSLPVSAPAAAAANTLTAEEQAAGWMLLFDGRTLDGWRVLKGSPEDAWRVEDGCIVTAGTPGEPRQAWGYLVSQATFADFELSFEWKVSAKANSGVFYRVVPGRVEAAPEYQILDNGGYADGKVPERAAGSMWTVAGPDRDVTRPVGQFNEGRIVCRGTQVEHWLNGGKVVEGDMTSLAWAPALERKRTRYPGTVDSPSGVLILHNLAPTAAYRNLKIRRLQR